jgi:uncharacterized protein (DUF362 family)/Pyruvate/2-oxoacid:ferredoxin oxidoreductase delta subunit
MKDCKVFIKTAEDLKTTIAEVFADLGLTNVSGKKVFLKPNMFRAAKPDEAVVTRPELIRETVSLLLNKGAQVIVGDNPVPTKTCNELEAAKICGYIDAAQGCFRNIGRYSRKLRRKKNLLREIYVAREILDCDILISLPKFRPHELTRMSLSIKNHFGIVPGGLKPYIHSRFPKITDFSKVLLEIYNLRPPDVIIVDCINFRDNRGKLFTPNIVVAGDNGHAVDYICALMAGINPMSIPTLKIAKTDGLFNPDKIELVGELEKLESYALPFKFPLRNTIVEFFAQILYRVWLGRVPVIDSSVCSKCLSCENVCPVRAIKNQRIDYKKCIKCYCCLEVCPNDAISTKFRI